MRELCSNMLFILLTPLGWRLRPQGLDRLKNNLIVRPCYLCYNIIDSLGCQMAFFNNVVSVKGKL